MKYKAVTNSVATILMIASFILGMAIHFVIYGISASQAKAELETYCDIQSLKGDSVLYLYVYKKSDPDFYKWVHRLSQEFDEVIIEYSSDYYNRSRYEE